MDNKKKFAVGVGALALLALAFVSGRYSRPARVEVREHVVTQIKTETKIVDRDVIKTQIVHDVVQSKNVVTQTVWRTAPDGRPEVVQTVKDLTKTEEQTKADQSATHDRVAESSTVIKIDATKSTITTYTRPSWSVAVMPGLDVRGVVADGLSNLTGAGVVKRGVLGASVERSILGPVFVGVWGNTAGAGGLTARIEF